MNHLIKDARNLPCPDPVAAVSVSPITLDVPGRAVPLTLRITAPMVGDRLPVVLLSHGGGPSLYISSKDGYAPLADFYAEHGFAVIQPTHLNSKVAGWPPGTPGAPPFWRGRVDDMRAILDRFDEIEALARVFAGRLDRGRIAVVGHSMGGQTAGMLLGARLTDPMDAAATDVDAIEPRIRAGVLLAAPGHGGKDLTDFAARHYSALNPDFSRMVTPTLVVVGDSDSSTHLTTRGAGWHEDAYHHGPGADALLTLIGGKHGLGGIAGYDAAETDDEDPDRLAITQRMTWAYLRSAFDPTEPAWRDACAALAAHASTHARVDLKGEAGRSTGSRPAA